MPYLRRLRIFFAAFCDWFVPLLFFVPSTIGGWFVCFGLLSTANMLIASAIISAIAACYLVAAEKNEGEAK
jgi:hypothetical protein